ncbi:PREDICTED: probable transcription factor At4g00610 [Camelina sativa]|uniref:Probable transcription factor At4g00610 n=1 Tax=Camelina sativa TaxID=90675 RepID=A0ABM1QHV7_CAMSA|nr:PREDICTED: probable transcription factor At4g00610 [Camelina sativa]
MAKKKQPQPPLVTPSPAKEPSVVSSPVKKPTELTSTSPESGLEEEESGSKSEESGSESEGEEDETPKNPETASAPVVANEISGLESKSVSDSEYEPEHEPEPTSAATVASPNKKRQSERGVVSTEVNPSKRSKTESSGTYIAVKKEMFQRIWSEEDEVLLLQGMIDYRSKTGNNTSDDTNGFFKSIKSSFNFEVKSLHQFTNKIWGLKK